MPARTPLSTTALVVAIAAATTGCGRGDDSSSPAPPPGATSPGSPARPTTASPTASPTAQPFSSQVKRVDRRTVRYSWREGCPVPLSGLRLIEMTHLGMDGRPHQGQMVVNARAADDIVKTFRRLYEIRFPIRRMQLVDAYRASDFDSIEANNTSAFNCRRATGSTTWSQHAYGLAVDINPCENPYVSASGEVAHEDCVKFRNRSRRDPGMIHAGDRVVRAFRAIGWGWGGSWSGTRDYQHFSESGR